jgi:hypothetical protein
MRIKYHGWWLKVDYIRVDNDDDNIDPNFIDDIEFNGKYFGKEEIFPVKKGSLKVAAESEVIPTYPKGRVTDGEYDVMKVGKEDNFPTKKNGLWAVGDEVMTIDTDGKIFHGKISEMIGDGMCQVMNRDGDTLTGVLLSKLVDDSDGADPNYTAAQINAMQAEYWQHQNDWRGGCKLDNNLPDGNAIDWEQRQFFLAAQIYAHKDCLYPDCMTEAKNFIDHYREETKL